MPYKCCAYGCNNVDGVDKNIKLFRFPLNETTKKEWVNAIQRKDFTATKYSRLCSAHFNPNDFVENPDRLILKEGIVPSNFNYPATHIQKYRKKKLTGNVYSPVLDEIVQNNSSLDDLTPLNEMDTAIDLTYYGPNTSLSPHTPTYTPSLQRKKLKRKIEESPVKSSLRKKVKALQQTVRRQKLKITTIEVLFNDSMVGVVICGIR
ncbi:THAP domain-containing protein 1-like [Aphis gossypii]|uniref:THAP domain-containing protein 1-like n=1 Tax=Aphis gossypii TaxID=80765 RepID=UPI0021590841|nr:THAP domain-containing protein 1-like [Aphis gossypii]